MRAYAGGVPLPPAMPVFLPPPPYVPEKELTESVKQLYAESVASRALLDPKLLPAIDGVGIDGAGGAAGAAGADGAAGAAGAASGAAPAGDAAGGAAPAS